MFTVRVGARGSSLFDFPPHLLKMLPLLNFVTGPDKSIDLETYLFRAFFVIELPRGFGFSEKDFFFF